VAASSPTIVVVKPEPFVIPWRGRQLRVRHDDPAIGTYTPAWQRIRAAVELASDVEGLRLVRASTVGDRYRVKVSDDGETVGFWRLR
jgi:hypothetical protein